MATVGKIKQWVNISWCDWNVIKLQKHQGWNLRFLLPRPQKWIEHPAMLDAEYVFIKTTQRLSMRRITGLNAGLYATHISPTLQQYEDTQSGFLSRLLMQVQIKRVRLMLWKMLLSSARSIRNSSCSTRCHTDHSQLGKGLCHQINSVSSAFLYFRWNSCYLKLDLASY